MFISTKNKASKKVVHYEQCPYAHNIHEDNKIYIYNLRDALNNNYYFCHYCSPLSKKYKKEKVAIDKFCKTYQLTYKYKSGLIFVQDILFKWIISFSGKNFLVYHQNAHKKLTSNKILGSPFTLGYHKQKIRGATLLEIFYAIYDHQDSYKYRHLNKKQIKIFYDNYAKKQSKNKTKLKKSIKQKTKRQQIKTVLDLIDNLANK